MYLSALLGQSVIPMVVPLCGTEHDNVHHALHHLINEGQQGGHRFAGRTQGYIEVAWQWWQGALVVGHPFPPG